MIDVTMCEKHKVDLARLEWERTVVQLLKCLRPLKQAAIDEERTFRCAHQRARTGDNACRAAKPNGYSHNSPQLAAANDIWKRS